MTGEDCVVVGGLGFVGRATRKSLEIPYYFDKKGSNVTLEEASRKALVFLCLPTPTDEKGGQEPGVNAMREIIQTIREFGGRSIFVVRSTVLPGTCRALSQEFGVTVASNPELLSEETWIRDATNPRMTIIGGDDVPAKNALVDLWSKRANKHSMVVTNTVTAEMLKYAFNTFFVSKIVYANQLYDICEKAGVDYKVIQEALTKHPWGSKHHFKVFHKGGRGGGGHCLPKDIKAFAKYSNLPFFQKVEELNIGYLQASRKT